MPLFTGKIKPNVFIGYFLCKANLDYDEIWYPVNKLGGFHLIILGALISVNALASLYFYSSLMAQVIIIKINAFIVITGLAYSLFRTWLLSRQLTLKIKSHKSNPKKPAHKK